MIKINKKKMKKFQFEFKAIKTVEAESLNAAKRRFAEENEGFSPGFIVELDGNTAISGLDVTGCDEFTGVAITEGDKYTVGGEDWIYNLEELSKDND